MTATAPATSRWGRASRCRTGVGRLGSAARTASPAGLSIRYPCAIAHRMTALIRWWTFRAVTYFPVQIGISVAMMSAVVTSSTARPPMWGKHVVAHARLPLRRRLAALPPSALVDRADPRGRLPERRHAG